MAPSQNSPKASAPLPHNKGSPTTRTGSSAISITQKSNCGTDSLNSYKMSSEHSWPQAVFSKENQRPPVYNPEDYVQALKKYGKRQHGSNSRSIYDTTETQNQSEDTSKSTTLPSKHTDYKSPIPSPPESESEMSLRQFASVTDLLTKLRADLRVSFPSFVQEFIAQPSDGVSLLLEVLRAIQLSQASNAPINVTAMQGTIPRNNQSYQRRALLDELACLQCLSICCTRSLEATARLGSTPVGLMPLASSATGQGIRARILAMQLMAAACDKHTLNHGSQKFAAAGHTAISEAMSTLRLRCSEPVRFRLLVGMLNSGGGSGELQAVGVKFINSFLDSAENIQQRLYLQAELFQAGFEPSTLAKTISSSSPWLDTLRNEIKRFNELYVDVDKMIAQARDADRVRSQMVILERRVQILHEEKAVLTSMERRLQERCAELQREIFRLQGAQSKQPVALPRHVSQEHHSKQDSSEHEDEGISSSETGPSLSPVPILVLPQKDGLTELDVKFGHNKNLEKPEDATTIEDVIEELDNIVSEAEKQISSSHTASNRQCEASEKEIIPILVPQPPRKSRAFHHLVSQPGGGSDLDDGSEYGMLLMQQQNAAPSPDQAMVERVQAIQQFFDDADYDMTERYNSFPPLEPHDIPEVTASTLGYNTNTTRELLDVIMNARHNEDDPTMRALREGAAQASAIVGAPNGHAHPHAHAHTHASGNAGKRHSYVSLNSAEPHPKLTAPPQHFNGVFFMSDMNAPARYPKPDLSAALQARRVTKNVERLEAVFANHASHASLQEAEQQAGREKSRSNQQIYFGSNPALRINSSYNSITNQVTVVHSDSHANNNAMASGNAGNNFTINCNGTANGISGNSNSNSNSNGNGNSNSTSNLATRTRSYTQGSKVTDTLSGLY